MLDSGRWKQAGVLIIVVAGLLAVGTWSTAQTPRTYVGSLKCKQCHEEQYASYKAHSKKAHSYSSIEKMRKGLTDQELKHCYECHTTGFGKSGGFRSFKDTPHMADLGCEACHGPGSAHATSESPIQIKGKLTVKDCEVCHNPERVESFKYSPLIFGGGH